jgi:hypothetical protein
MLDVLAAKARRRDGGGAGARHDVAGDMRHLRVDERLTLIIARFATLNEQDSLHPRGL